jgi:hypothetical protein
MPENVLAFVTKSIKKTFYYLLSPSPHVVPSNFGHFDRGLGQGRFK